MQLRYSLLTLLPLLTCAIASTPRRQLMDNLPLRFEENRDRSAANRAPYLARGRNFVLQLLPAESSLEWKDGNQSSRIRTRLLGANRNARMEPEDRLAGLANYFIGSSAHEWRTDVTGFGRIRHHDVYPGIDLVFHGEQGRLEYDFVIAPHADPSLIRLELTGHRSLRVDRDGDLIVSTRAGEIRWKKPRVYQNAGATAVSGRFVISGNRVRFDLGNYDHDRLLVIDPVLSYSTYLGGSDVDGARGIARDSAGNVYIAGSTNSMNLDTVSAFQPNFGGRSASNIPQGDGFVAKFSPAGALLYLTYIGGSLDDYVTGIAVDGAGNAYITGATTSSNFPTVNAFQSQFGGMLGYGNHIRTGDAFVAKLNPAGNKLIYSTYLGGSQDDVAFAIAIDSTGSAYVTGATVSPNFPVQGAGNTFPFQSSFRGLGGEPIKDCGGCTGPFWDPGDAFVAKFDPTGSQLIFSTYLGGELDDAAFTLAIDSSNNVYVAGCTLSSVFPITQGALQVSNKGTNGENPWQVMGDGFITKLNSTGSALIYSTFLGGSGDDCVSAITVDSTGAVYFTGSSDSTDLPVTEGAFQSAMAGYPPNNIPLLVEQDIGDAIVGKLDPTGSTLLYLTYLGGSRNDAGTAIAIDSSGSAYVTGFTNSTDFPLAGASFQTVFGGYSQTTSSPNFSLTAQGDAFLTLVNPTGTALFYSTYLGGSGTDGGGGVLLDGSGGVYIAGGTQSTNFPITSNAAQSKNAGLGDAFYSVFTGFPPTPPILSSVANAFGNSTSIAANTWVAIKGSGLSITTRTWQASDFVAGQMPTQLDNVSVTMNGENVYLYYISGQQLNVLTPPDLAKSGPVTVQVSVGGVISQTFTVQSNLYSVSLFVFDTGTNPSVVATHLDGTIIGPPGLIPGVPTTPAQPGEEVVVYGNGFGPVNPPVTKGSEVQMGTLPAPLPQFVFNGSPLDPSAVLFGGLVSPGLYQFNIVLPTSAPSGNITLQAVYGNQVSQTTSIYVQ